MSSPKRVLIIDDDEGIRDFVALALTDEGYEVRGAPHGAAALEIVAAWSPDVILLDLRMAVMDGSQFSRAYRALPGPHAPLIVLTAANNPVEGALDVQADDYLAKPFELDALLLLVSKYTHRDGG